MINNMLMKIYIIVYTQKMHLLYDLFIIITPSWNTLKFAAIKTNFQ